MSFPYNMDHHFDESLPPEYRDFSKLQHTIEENEDYIDELLSDCSGSSFEDDDDDNESEEECPINSFDYSHATFNTKYTLELLDSMSVISGISFQVVGDDDPFLIENIDRNLSLIPGEMIIRDKFLSDDEFTYVSVSSTEELSDDDSLSDEEGDWEEEIKVPIIDTSASLSQDNHKDQESNKDKSFVVAQENRVSQLSYGQDVGGKRRRFLRNLKSFQKLNWKKPPLSDPDCDVGLTKSNAKETIRLPPRSLSMDKQLPKMRQIVRLPSRSISMDKNQSRFLRIFRGR